MDKKEIEYCGLKIVVNNETYAEYKGTLEEQIEILQQENLLLKENAEHNDLWNTLKDMEKDSFNTFKPNTTLKDLEEGFKNDE